MGGTLHAKLYLCFRTDPNNPITGFLGSSNLTLAGLSNQGELNVDVLDQDATKKLEQWFNDRWGDKWCVDITKELIQVIDESWARPECPPPYQIYVKMAYHLAEEARAGLSEFTIPPDMRDTLLEFQSAAVRIAARHLEKRGGVILGDVVGLGKTLMATALARVFQDPPRSLETLILCPKNLVGMWEDYAHDPQRRPLLPLPLHGECDQAGRALHCRRHQAPPGGSATLNHRPSTLNRSGSGGVSHLPRLPGRVFFCSRTHPSPEARHAMASTPSIPRGSAPDSPRTLRSATARTARSPPLQFLNKFHHRSSQSLNMGKVYCRCNRRSLLLTSGQRVKRRQNKNNNEEYEKQTDHRRRRGLGTVAG